MIKNLETDFLERELRNAQQELNAGQTEQAKQHFERAFNEAMWLCDHYIEYQQSDLAQEAYLLLKKASQGYKDCNLQESQQTLLSSHMHEIHSKMRAAFGLFAEGFLAQLDKKASSPLRIAS